MRRTGFGEGRVEDFGVRIQRFGGGKCGRFWGEKGWIWGERVERFWGED